MYLKGSISSQLRDCSGRKFLAIVAFFFSFICCPAIAQPLVAAASDLKFALEDIAKRYREETGLAVRLVFGASGNLTTQILQGAPFDLFLSADAAFTRKLFQAGLTLDPGLMFGLGRLVLYVPKGSDLKADPELASIGQALKAGTLKRLAIANPEHAPYGQRAVQVLQKQGLWALAQPRLVLGENVAQAASFAYTGNAQAALIAWSLALAPPLSQEGHFVLLPESLHEPLLQTMVLMKKAEAPARSFYAYLQQGSAKAILASHGFKSSH